MIIALKDAVITMATVQAPMVILIIASIIHAIITMIQISSLFGQ